MNDKTNSGHQFSEGGEVPKADIYRCIDCGVEIELSSKKTYELCEKCLNNFDHKSEGGEVPKLTKEQQNELWREAIALFNKKEHTQDGRDLVMKSFTITKRPATGSVAAPNIEKEIRNKAIDDCIEKLKLIVNGSELTGELESLKI